jgi:hypothetical protein
VDQYAHSRHLRNDGYGENRVHGHAYPVTKTRRSCALVIEQLSRNKLYALGLRMPANRGTGMIAWCNVEFSLYRVAARKFDLIILDECGFLRRYFINIMGWMFDFVLGNVSNSYLQAAINFSFYRHACSSLTCLFSDIMNTSSSHKSKVHEIRKAGCHSSFALDY